MSYQALARTWRPGKFAELVGQEHVIKALVHALDDDRLHHAYLFTGTRGVGKTTIARIFAKCLNCEKGGLYFLSTNQPYSSTCSSESVSPWVSTQLTLKWSPGLAPSKLKLK